MRLALALVLALALAACGGGDDSSPAGTGGSGGSGFDSGGSAGSGALGGAGGTTPAGGSAGTGGSTGGSAGASGGSAGATASGGTGGAGVPGPLHVNGVKLGTNEEKWVRYIGEKLVPELVGTRDERIHKASIVAWWALKEGVLDLGNPLAYSNCSFPPDEQIGPTEVCPDPNNAWQVGISGVQAAWRTLASVETLAKSVHPADSLTQTLANAALAAGFAKGSTTYQAIVASTDRLRISWLLRDGAVGFEAEYPVVVGECFGSTPKSWCFSKSWSPSSKFAPDAAGAKASVSDLASLFDQLAP